VNADGGITGDDIEAFFRALRGRVLETRPQAELDFSFFERG